MTAEHLGQFAHLRAEDDLPERLPDLSELVLEFGAKFTDVMSCRYLDLDYGLLESQAFRELVDRMESGRSISSSVSFARQSQMIGYVFQFFAPCYEAIDWQESEFRELTLSDNSFVADHSFASTEDYFARRYSSLTSIVNNLEPSRISLAHKWDILRIPSDVVSLHISERMAQEIHEAGLTGIQVVDTDVIFD